MVFLFSHGFPMVFPTVFLWIAMKKIFQNEPGARLRPRQELLPRPGPRGLRQLRWRRGFRGAGGAAPHRAGAHGGDGPGAGDPGGRPRAGDDNVFVGDFFPRKNGGTVGKSAFSIIEMDETWWNFMFQQWETPLLEAFGGLEGCVDDIYGRFGVFSLRYTYLPTYIHTYLPTYIHACMHAYIYIYTCYWMTWKFGRKHVWNQNWRTDTLWLKIRQRDGKHAVS